MDFNKIKSTWILVVIFVLRVHANQLPDSQRDVLPSTTTSESKADGQGTSDVTTTEVDSNVSIAETTTSPYMDNLSDSITYSQLETSNTDSSINETATTETVTIETTLQTDISSNVTIYTKTDAMETTSRRPENCMLSRKDDFIRCMKGLGDNAQAFVTANNMSGFIDDMCDSNGSKSYMECLQRHFQECPEFLTRPEVEVLQFGPYHIKDVTYFSSIDQMCSCITGLVCIQELIKIKKITTFYEDNKTSPWKLPKYILLCDNTVSKNIGCVRQNLRQCQSPLTKRYGQDFTNDDAEDIKHFYSFNKEHCNTVKKDDFREKISCIRNQSTSEKFRECVTDSNSLNGERRLCQMRQCVEDIISDECDDDEESDDLVSLYIDAVNVYRRDSHRLLNNVCSGTVSLHISFILSIVSVVLVSIVSK